MSSSSEFDWIKLAREWKENKKTLFERNANATFTPQYLEKTEKRILDAIEKTAGLSDITKIEDWLSLYPKVAAPHSKLNELNNLIDFADFLAKKHADSQIYQRFERARKLLDDEANIYEKNSLWKKTKEVMERVEVPDA